MIYRSVTLASIALAFGTLGFLVNDREMPVTVYEMGMLNDVVPAGEVGRARYRFRRSRSCETHVYRSLYDSAAQRFIISDLHFPAGILPIGEDKATVPFQVSPAATKGPATYRTLNCYVCNFTQILWPICDNPRDIRLTIE